MKHNLRPLPLWRALFEVALLAIVLSFDPGSARAAGTNEEFTLQKLSGVWTQENRQFASFSIRSDYPVQKGDEFLVVRGNVPLGILRVNQTAVLHVYGVFQSAPVAYSQDEMELKMGDAVLLPLANREQIDRERSGLKPLEGPDAMVLYGLEARNKLFLFLDKGAKDGLSLKESGSLIRNQDIAGAIEVLVTGEKRSLAVYQKKDPEVTPVFGDQILMLGPAALESPAPEPKPERVPPPPKLEIQPKEQTWEFPEAPTVPASAKEKEQPPLAKKEEPAKLKPQAPSKAAPAAPVKQAAPERIEPREEAVRVSPPPAAPAPLPEKSKTADSSLDSFISYSASPSAPDRSGEQTIELTPFRSAPPLQNPPPARVNGKDRQKEVRISLAAQALAVPGISESASPGAAVYDWTDYGTIFQTTAPALGRMDAESSGASLSFSRDGLDFVVGHNSFRTRTRTASGVTSDTIEGESFALRAALNPDATEADGVPLYAMGFQYFGGENPSFFKTFALAGLRLGKGEYWLGVENLSGGSHDGAGILLGARHSVSRNLEFKLDYSTRDMTKAILNENAFQTLKADPALAGSLAAYDSCPSCDGDALSLGVRYRFNRNAGLRFEQYDLLDLSASRVGADFSF